jgi:hypothetical protein
MTEFTCRGNIKQFKLQLKEATGARKGVLLQLLKVEKESLRAIEAGR